MFSKRPCQKPGSMQSSLQALQWRCGAALVARTCAIAEPPVDLALVVAVEELPPYTRCPLTCTRAGASGALRFSTMHLLCCSKRSSEREGGESQSRKFRFSLHVGCTLAWLMASCPAGAPSDCACALASMLPLSQAWMLLPCGQAGRRRQVGRRAQPRRLRPGASGRLHWWSLAPAWLGTGGGAMDSGWQRPTCATALPPCSVVALVAVSTVALLNACAWFTWLTARPPWTVLALASDLT